MDALFFHPRLVHVPVALGVLMPLIAAALALAWWRAWLPSKGFLLAVALQAVLVISGFLALRSGEEDEEIVEKIVAERLIDAHEEAAQRFVVASAVVLGLMLLSVVFARRRAGLPLAGAATLGTFVVFGLAYRTGESGGGLVYEHGAAAAHVRGPASGAPALGGGSEHSEHE